MVELQTIMPTPFAIALLSATFSLFTLDQIVYANEVDAVSKEWCTKAGWFGEGCRFKCHCRNGENCRVMDGHCKYGCEQGWVGQGCQDRDLQDSSRERRSIMGNQSHTTIDPKGKDAKRPNSPGGIGRVGVKVALGLVGFIAVFSVLAFFGQLPAFKNVRGRLRPGKGVTESHSWGSNIAELGSELPELPSVSTLTSFHITSNTTLEQVPMDTRRESQV